MGQARMAFVAGACACVACAFVVVPAAASADCTSSINTLENNVESFSGTASASYASGTQMAPDPPGEITMSIDHSASNVVLGDLLSNGTLAPGSGPQDAFANENGPTGGAVSVSDSYSNSNGGSSSQTGSGPTLPANNTESGEEGANDLQIDPTNCTYQFELSYSVATQTVGGAPDGPQDPGIDDRVMTPAEPIPANLVLEGSNSALPVQVDRPGAAGGYQLSYNNSWGTQFDQNFLPTTTTASMTWKLTPTYRRQAPPPPTAHCVVPRVDGLPQANAERKIKAAGCAVGAVTKQHSTKVPKGKVVSSSPKAGSQEPRGTKVKLVVSSGKKKK